MPHFIIKNSDGSIGIMQTFGDATPEECIEKWSAEAQAAVLEVIEIDPSEIPADRTYREAWEVPA